MNISVAPEEVFKIGGVGITNSLLSAFLIVVFLVIVILLLRRNFSKDHPTKWQLFFEMLIQAFRDMTMNEHTRPRVMLFSFFFSFLIFIMMSNWFGLLPWVGPVVYIPQEHIHTNSREIAYENNHEVNAPKDSEHAHKEKLNTEVSDRPSIKECIIERNCVLTLDGHLEQPEEAIPLFRAPTSDASATLALAIVSVIGTNYIAFLFLKFGFLKKYLDFSGGIPFFVGLLEIVSEVSKVLSFTFRLFGNIFAGELILLIITQLTFGLGTIPFMLLEVFVGFIQAFVFMMLTATFVSQAVEHH